MGKPNLNSTTFNYQRGGVSVALILMSQNKATDGTIPISWRITFKGRRKYLKTGLTLTADEWEDFCNKSLLKHKDVKLDLKKYFDNVICRAINDLVADNSFSLAAFENELSMGDRNSVNDAFKTRINSLRRDNAIGNAEIYTTAFNALQRFKYYKSLRGKAKDDFLQRCIDDRNVTIGKNKIAIPEQTIYFTELTPQFLKECDRFWRETGVSTSTISMRMRNLRAIINNVDTPYLTGKNYPFGKGKYLIPSGSRRQGFLEIDDIRKLENFETDHPDMALARDIFLFMFYGSGMNFKDLALLKYSDITFDNEFKFRRAKTDTGDNAQFVYVPILPPMVEIMNRHGNDKQDGYVFKFLNGIKNLPSSETKIKKILRQDLDPININLKRIAARLDLNTELSTNWARHSYISYLVNELSLNDITVKYMVGHSIKSNVTAGYAHSTPKKRREINSQLLDPTKDYSRVLGAVKRTI